MQIMGKKLIRHIALSLFVLISIQTGLLSVLQLIFFESNISCVHSTATDDERIFTYHFSNLPVMVKEGFFFSGKLEAYIDGHLTDVIKTEHKGDSVIVYIQEDHREEAWISHLGLCQMNKDRSVMEKNSHIPVFHKMFCPETDTPSDLSFISLENFSGVFTYTHQLPPRIQSEREGPPPDFSCFI